MAKRVPQFPTLRQPPEITFGAGSLRTLTSLPDLAQTAFFISGEPTVRAGLAAAFAKHDLELEQFSIIEKPPGEPTWPAIQFGAEFLRQSKFRRIVGLGGGSVLDWCRMAWAHSAGLLRLDSPRSLSAANLDLPEFWLVPTTCATGAEAASVAVYLHDGEKRPVMCEAFLASRVILDARFVASLSPAIRAQSLADALSHGIEAFLSIVPNYLAKEMALAALGSIFEHHGSEESCADERLLEAAYLGGLAASHCSVGIVHAFAHSVAKHGVPHGLANALALIPGIEANRQTPAALRLIERLGLANADELISRITSIVKVAQNDARVAPLLAVLKHADDRAALTTAIAADVCLRTNPRSFDVDEINNFLKQVELGVVVG